MEYCWPFFFDKVGRHLDRDSSPDDWNDKCRPQSVSHATLPAACQAARPAPSYATWRCARAFGCDTKLRLPRRHRNSSMHRARSARAAARGLRRRGVVVGAARVGGRAVEARRAVDHVPRLPLGCCTLRCNVSRCTTLHCTARRESERETRLGVVSHSLPSGGAAGRETA